MSIDWSQFVPDLIIAILTILVTLLGIWVGFKLNESQHKKIEKTEAKRLLFLLKKDVELNENLLFQLRDALKNNQTVFYNLSLVVWNSINPSLARVLRTEEIKDISEFYYQLQHVIRKVDMMFKIRYGSPYTEEASKRRQDMVDSLNQHIPSIFEGTICKSPQTIKAKIECLIKELR
jgi:hypothetical protein